MPNFAGIGSGGHQLKSRVLFVSPVLPFARPPTAAASSCTRRCRELADVTEAHVARMLDWPDRRRTTWNCANSARRPSGWCGLRTTRPAPGSLRPRAVRSRQRRSGLADPSPALPRAGSTCCSSNTRRRRNMRRLPPDRPRPVRARCLLPVDRARARPLLPASGRADGTHRISARAALRTAYAAALRPGAGLHARQMR